MGLRCLRMVRQWVQMDSWHLEIRLASIHSIAVVDELQILHGLFRPQLPRLLHLLPKRHHLADFLFLHQVALGKGHDQYLLHCLLVLLEVLVAAS